MLIKTELNLAGHLIMWPLSWQPSIVLKRHSAKAKSGRQACKNPEVNKKKILGVKYRQLEILGKTKKHF